MKPKKAATLNIAVALIFATAMIVSSIMIDDAEKANQTTFLIIALWIIPFIWINNQINKK